MSTFNYCVPCGIKSATTESACSHCGSSNLHRINFRWAQATVRQLGVMFALCNVTSNKENPVTSPPWWYELEETDEGRKELANRIRVLCTLTNSGFHGDERAFLLKEYAKRAGLQ